MQIDFNCDMARASALTGSFDEELIATLLATSPRFPAVTRCHSETVRWPRPRRGVCTTVC